MPLQHSVAALQPARPPTRHAPPAHCATVRVPRAEVQRILGRTAFAVWAALTTFRDKRTGNTFVGYERLARGCSVRIVGDSFDPEPISPGAARSRVKRALRRLKAARLTGAVVWTQVAGRDGKVAWRALRAVRGWFSGDDVVLPEEAHAAMKNLSTHGGKRAGAGRPKGRRASAENAPPTPNDHAVLEAIQDGAGSIKMALPADSKRPPIFSPSGSDLLLSEEDGRAARGPFLIFVQEVHVVTATPAPPPPPTSVDSAPQAPLPQPGVDAYQPAPRAGVVPPIPGMRVARPAHVPHPPLLDAKLPTRDKVGVLVTAYRSACAARGCKSFAFARGDVSRSKHYRALCEAVKALEEHDVPPIAWALWSIDQWRETQERRGAPPKAGGPGTPGITYVWSAGRVRGGQRGMFHDRQSDYDGGQVVYGRQHRELIDRWDRMNLDLLMSSAEEGSAAERAIVEKHFPCGMYDSLAMGACAEAVEIQGQLRACAARGEVMWGTR